MKILYEDDLYPGKKKEYIGKTIGQILEEHNDPQSFITRFNSANDNMCLSDEISVNRRHLGGFKRNWQRN